MITSNDLDVCCATCGSPASIDPTEIANIQHRYTLPDAPPVDPGWVVDTILAKRSPAWITVDEQGNESPACPTCIGQQKQQRATLTCPSWCTTNHANEPQRGEWYFVHASPASGQGITIEHPSSMDDGALEVLTDEAEWSLKGPEDYASCAAELLSRADSLHRAAAWLLSLDATQGRKA